MDDIVTKESCEILLQNYLKTSNYEIENIDVSCLTDKIPGMMAEYYQLTIKYKANGKSEVKNFFCKKLVQFHKIQEIMCKQQNAYEKEDYIYNFFIKACRNIPKYQIDFAPECYLSLEDDIFVLENLTEKGYKNVVAQDLKHSQIVLKTFAQFHASTIIYEEYQTSLTGKKYSLYEANPEVFQDSLFRKQDDYLGRKWFLNCVQTLAKLIDIAPKQKLSPEELKRKLYENAEKAYEVLTPSKIYRNVMCHGDQSFSNIMFFYDELGRPKKVKLVDFQALRYNPPAHDVMNYMYCTASSEIRRNHTEDLLEYYYQQLKDELNHHNIDIQKHITYEEFQESCRYVMPQVIIQVLAYSTMVPVKSFPHIRNDQELYKKYVYEDRSPECIADYKSNGQFKELFDTLIPDLCDL